MRNVLALLSTFVLIPVAAAAEPVQQYSGLCDASAGIAIDARHFVVADDESNTLRLYQHGKSAEVATIPLAEFLKTKADKESDVEGAARLGSRIYWISSHGRNKDGDLQSRRHRFFATDIGAGSPPSLVAVGVPYENLQEHLIKAADLSTFALDCAAQRKPEATGGFNIEGLATTPDGKLLIAWRNPVPGGKALLVPLENPGDLLAGDQSRAPRFGKPVLLDLEKRGVRSIELIGRAYYIVAGPSADEGGFALYRWSGAPGSAATPLAIELPSTFRPEALFEIPGRSSITLLSDDGAMQVNGEDCKKLEAPEQRSFRAVTVPLDSD